MCDWKQNGWYIAPQSKTGKRWRIVAGYTTVATAASADIASYIADMHNARLVPSHATPREAVTR